MRWIETNWSSRRERFLIYGGLLVACVVIFRLLSGRSQAPPSFSLIPVAQITKPGTNVIIFRLTSLDVTRLSLADLGHIEVPLKLTNAHPGHLPLWERFFCPALSSTNFAPAEFRRRIEFGIVAPTNRIWRLQIHLERTVRLNVWKERMLKEWECLKAFD
ncbi:MAG TPA: hypothetical protein VFA77_01465, partial [Candidatus Eisenbacteria bacterium]|nr:hypothetical protein [Candidatus Eisenbacteria bacterium]